MRLACLSVPLFPLAARLRSEPDLKGETVAVFEGNGNTARVVAATRQARKAGVEIGMTLPQARAILPRLVARARDLESERTAQEALLEVADTFSPRVEDGSEGVVYMDLEGLPSLRPLPAKARESGAEEGASQNGRPQGPPLRTEESENPGSGGSRFVGAGLAPARKLVTRHSSPVAAELQFGRDLIDAAEKAGLPARAGLAASKLAARVAAGLPESPTVVAPGEESSFLAPLPLARLTPAMEIAQTLESWGLASIGDFAKLPEGEVASRLGELGRCLHATARGLDPRPLEPRLPAVCFSEGMELEWPLVTLEPFLFVGNAALERLMRRLESQALACTRLEVTLKLDPDGCDARAITLPAPTRDVKTMLTLVRLELEARPPVAAVAGFTFAAHPDRPRRAQLSLFGPPALSPDRLATTIARLASMLGADRVGSPRAVDGHRPERYAVVDYAPPPAPSFLSPRKTGRGLLSVRVLRPPVDLEVITHPSVPASVQGEGRTTSVRSSVPASPQSPLPAGEGQGEGGDPIANHQSKPTRSSIHRPLSLKSIPRDGSPEIFGSVKVASGPWSMEEGWWSESPADRDYWDIELADGALYRIYRDNKTDAWFADGIYD